jgi:hypothetical protein
MTTILASTLTELTTSVVSLLLGWILFFWLYRDYRVDLLRERLFSVRDELFDLADSGRLDFDHPAYGMLRRTINGTIRHADRISLAEVFSVVYVHRDPLIRAATLEYRDSWEKALSETSPEIRQQLRTLRGKLHYLVADQVIFTSALLLATGVVFAAWLVVRSLQLRVANGVRSFAGDSRVDSCAAAFDSVSSLREDAESRMACPA